MHWGSFWRWSNHYFSQSSIGGSLAEPGLAVFFACLMASSISSCCLLHSVLSFFSTSVIWSLYSAAKVPSILCSEISKTSRFLLEICWQTWKSCSRLIVSFQLFSFKLFVSRGCFEMLDRDYAGLFYNRLWNWPQRACRFYPSKTSSHSEGKGQVHHFEAEGLSQCGTIVSPCYELIHLAVPNRFCSFLRP